VPGVCPVDRGARKSDWMCIYLLLLYYDEDEVSGAER